MFKINEIESPDFLKKLNIKELEQLCTEIREFIIENVSHTGGHLSSNLGVVEATVALHYVFDSPTDKFVFDVGHQCYTHKVLTGRAKEFVNLRKQNGIDGFPKYYESIHDVWEAGHSSTSLSAAAGFLEAKAINTEIGEVIAFIGDGAIQNGLAFEGLNYIGSQKQQKAIIILNDNEMSISRNVGRMAKTFSRTRVKRGHMRLRKIIPSFVLKPFRSLKNALKVFIYGNDLFTSLGYRYYGPIDGHNIKQLIKYFEYAKKSEYSIVIHLNTIKGKGYQYSESDINGNWHGTGPFEVMTGKPLKKDIVAVPWGSAIADIVNELMIKKDNIYVITPAMLVGSYLKGLHDKYNGRVIDVGINEEHAVVMSASMSRNGIIPIVCMYSTFFQRVYDALNHDVCRNNNHVIFLLDHAGIVSADGDTHQGTFDISMMISLPNLIICMPKNNLEAKSLLELAMDHSAPIAIRYPKGNTIIECGNNSPVYIGKWIIEKEISKINIIAYGDIVNDLLTKLANKSIGLINALFIKPIDIDILKLLTGTKVIIIEEVMKISSLSTLIMMANQELNLSLNIKSYGVDDVYLGRGSKDELLTSIGIDIDQIIKEL